MRQLSAVIRGSRLASLRAAAGPGKPKPNLQARRVIKHLDPRPVETGSGGDKAEPEAVSRAAPALFEPIKGLQHVFALVRGNPRP